MKTWVAVVNRAEARIFEVNEKPELRNGRPIDRLKLLKKIENPKGRLKNIDINADRPGFSRNSVSFSGTRLAKAQEPTERVADMFAKQVSEELEMAYNDHLFESLILVVEPRFLGRLRTYLSKKTFNTVRETIHKDLVNVSQHDLPDFIWPKEPEISRVL